MDLAAPLLLLAEDIVDARFPQIGQMDISNGNTKYFPTIASVNNELSSSAILLKSR